MFESVTRLCAALSLCVAVGAGCDKDKASNDPESGGNLLGLSTNDGAGGGDLDLEEEDDDLFGDEESSEWEDAEGEEPVAEAPKKKLPPRAKPVQKCKKVKEGKKRKKVCGLVDPKPKVSAAYGVVALLGDFQWGMTPKQVFKVLSKDIEDEYAKRQKATDNAMEQDRNRAWRKDQLQAIKANHTKFTTGSKHRWGVSLIQYEYEDDANEEMLWVSNGQGLRKFYFFKDGELWKVFYAYSTEVWPGKSYADVVEEKFKKWFGPSPQQKVKQDPKTAEPILRYNEWEALEGEKIRSFDLTQVHGVIGLAVVDGRAEERIGERLPNLPREQNYTDVVQDVLGGTDVCYNDNGDIVECGSSGDVSID